MNKIFISILIVIVFIGILAWLGDSASSKDKVSAPSALIVEDGLKTYNFGTISMGKGKVSHSFKIRNSGNEVMQMERMYTSCMCTSASLTKGDDRFGPYGMPGHGLVPSLNQSLDPNQEATVEVIFDPAAHGPSGVGKIERSVIIENGSGRLMEHGITAFVTP